MALAEKETSAEAAAASVVRGALRNKTEDNVSVVCCFLQSVWRQLLPEVGELERGRSGGVNTGTCSPLMQWYGKQAHAVGTRLWSQTVAGAQLPEGDSQLDALEPGLQRMRLACHQNQNKVSAWMLMCFSLSLFDDRAVGCRTPSAAQKLCDGSRRMWSGWRASGAR